MPASRDTPCALCTNTVPPSPRGDASMIASTPSSLKNCARRASGFCPPPPPRPDRRRARAAGSRAAAAAAAADVGLGLEPGELLVGVAVAGRGEERQHLAHRRHERELAAQLALVLRVVLVGLDVDHDRLTRDQAVGAVGPGLRDSR